MTAADERAAVVAQANERKPRAGYVTVIPLEGWSVSVHIPDDMTPEEATKVSRVLMAYADCGEHKETNDGK